MDSRNLRETFESPATLQALGVVRRFARMRMQQLERQVRKNPGAPDTTHRTFGQADAWEEVLRVTQSLAENPSAFLKQIEQWEENEYAETGE